MSTNSSYFSQRILDEVTNFSKTNYNKDFGDGMLGTWGYAPHVHYWGLIYYADRSYLSNSIMLDDLFLCIHQFKIGVHHDVNFMPDYTNPIGLAYARILHYWHDVPNKHLNLSFRSGTIVQALGVYKNIVVIKQPSLVPMWYYDRIQAGDALLGT